MLTFIRFYDNMYVVPKGTQKKGGYLMKFNINWVDCGEIVNSETVGMFTATEILKGYGMEESSACVLLHRIVNPYPVVIRDCGGYTLIIMKVEG